MLFLVSLGISGCDDISLKGLNILKKADVIYFEHYTDIINCSRKELEQLVGRHIKEVNRSFIEENSRNIVGQSQDSNVAILVGGDALAATTHSELVLEAKKANIKCKIIHSSSIMTAIAETGLQLYKFGYSVSIPKYTENYKPDSFYDRILVNMKNNMHTLILLDIGMKLNQALDILLSIEKKYNKGIFRGKIVVCVALGSNNQQIIYGYLEDIKKRNIDSIPVSIIVPSELHFKEKEMLEMFE